MVKELVHSLYEFVVCVTTNNAELFFNAFPTEKSGFLVQDRLQCVARVNCLVNISTDGQDEQN